MLEDRVGGGAVGKVFTHMHFPLSGYLYPKSEIPEGLKSLTKREEKNETTRANLGQICSRACVLYCSDEAETT